MSFGAQLCNTHTSRAYGLYDISCRLRYGFQHSHYIFFSVLIRCSYDESDTWPFVVGAVSVRRLWFVCYGEFTPVLRQIGRMGMDFPDIKSCFPWRKTNNAHTHTHTWMHWTIISFFSSFTGARTRLSRDTKFIARIHFNGLGFVMIDSIELSCVDQCYTPIKLRSLTVVVSAPPNFHTFPNKLLHACGYLTHDNLLHSPNSGRPISHWKINRFFIDSDNFSFEIYCDTKDQR